VSSEQKGKQNPLTAKDTKR